MTPNWAIAITTLNRRDVYLQTLREICKHTPDGVPIVVVDDGSDIPVPHDPRITVWRNKEPTGIARAKNKCLELLMAMPGVEHLFLLDDDVYPTESGWYTGFLESGEHHLIHQPIERRWCQRCSIETLWVYNTVAGHFDCATCVPAVKQTEIRDGMWSVEWGAGVMYYLTREAVNTVGGLRPEFNRWSCETWEYSYRIRNAGLIKYPFQILPHSPFHSLDAYKTGRRSCVPDDVRNAHRQRNWDLFQSFRDTSEFVPYIEEPFDVTDVTVCLPWRPTPDRIPAHDRCIKYWCDNGFQVIESDSDPEHGWLCNQARNNAVRQADSDIVVIADADTLPDNITQVHEAITMIRTGHADIVWAFDVYRHIPGSAVEVEDLSTVSIDKEYRHGSPGGIIVASVEKFWEIGGFDEKFERGAWGFDDEAFMLTARTLLTTARIPGAIWSFNHGVSEYVTGGRDLTDANPNKARAKLFQFADGQPDVMRALLR